MKNTLLLLTFSFVTIFASGQTWAPIGAKWTFGIINDFSPWQGYNEWTSTGDTLVGGHNCRVIQRTYGWGALGDIDNGKLIIYEDNNVVYFYQANQFTVLYDFNKTAGETWITVIDSCESVITVDSVGMDTINGFPLKALYITSEGPTFGGKILQYIGDVGRPTPNNSYYCLGFVVDGIIYTGLRCYEDSVLGFHNFNIASTCDYTTSSIEEVEDEFGLSISPNPTSNQITIQTKMPQQLSFNIYNTLGQLLKQGITQGNFTTIELNNLAAGIYSIELRSDNKAQRKCFIVQK
ncbi:MAG: T9SS type A sorting domain-containing protein [Saprospiraceae bacterium]|nr:T9SS type A sorting domain-containing protein [Saprospiraceae bacterium]MBP7680202.1 T9SS type A sorting domain-containing protein [Saprospiraceae bacterium]